MRKLTQEQLHKEYSEAFNALPEPYQNDNCLDFYVCGLGKTFFACAKDGQEFAIGDHMFYFHSGDKEWRQSKFRKHVVLEVMNTWV